MKEMNLTRLLNSCCVKIPKGVHDALFDYLMEVEVDLNTINVDDLYVNSVYSIHKKDVTEDSTILCEDDTDDTMVYVFT